MIIIIIMLMIMIMVFLSCASPVSSGSRHLQGCGAMILPKCRTPSTSSPTAAAGAHRLRQAVRKPGFISQLVSAGLGLLAQTPRKWRKSSSTKRKTHTQKHTHTHRDTRTHQCQRILSVHSLRGRTCLRERVKKSLREHVFIHLCKLFWTPSLREQVSQTVSDSLRLGSALCKPCRL